MVEKIFEEFGMCKVVREFVSIDEFYKYLVKTEYNSVFKKNRKNSIKHNEEFTGTKSFEEAVDLMKNGWKEVSQELNQRIKIKKTEVEKTRKRSVYDVSGYNVSVPRYLMGIPDSMVNSKNVKVKEKAVVINKSIMYNWRVKKEEIIKESTKVISLINKIEKQGVRCQLNLVISSYSEYEEHLECVKIKVKSQRERLNISKLSFPLVHPSMLRRIFLRYLEVSPTVTQGYTDGYGNPKTGEIEARFLCKGEYFFPSFINSEINSIDDMKMFYVFP